MAEPYAPSAPEQDGRRRFTLFAYGFRPFFLAALSYAALAIPAWLGVRAVGGLPLNSFPPQLWHGHEMVFGFAGAAIAGFLLTAVPSWTGARGFAGAPLMALGTLWLAARVAFFFVPHVPVPLLALVELTFLPALAFLIGRPLLRARNRNTPLLIVLAALWLADVAFMYALEHTDVVLASTALRTSINILLLLITVIGGRIVPAFTGNALRSRGVAVEVRSQRWLEIATIAATALVVIIDMVRPLHSAAAVLAFIAACAHAVRLAGWRGWRTGREPIVWILHVAYAWMPIGFALKGVYLMSAAPWAMQWLHALTLGSIALMIVAVITRASLGHTGRPLVVSRGVAVGYGFLIGAALTRVWGPSIPGLFYETTVQVSGGLWLVGFVLILAVYAPILMRARVDGRPG